MSKLSKVVLIFCLFFFNNINSIKIKNEKNTLNSKFFFNSFKNNNKKENKKNNYPDDYLNIIVSHKKDESADRIEPDHTFNETLKDIINTFVSDSTEEVIPKQVNTQTSQTPTEETKPYLETIAEDNNNVNNQQETKQDEQQEIEQKQAQQQKAQ